MRSPSTRSEGAADRAVSRKRPPIEKPAMAAARCVVKRRRFMGSSVKGTQAISMRQRLRAVPQHVPADGGQRVQPFGDRSRKWLPARAPALLAKCVRP